jgi:hypothetical protein
VDLFHIGPQKSATTWVYRCISEHEGVFVPHTNTIHYYDMKYHKGREWYETFFEEARRGQVRLDATMTYIRSPWAARRIAKENPDAKIMVCLRNPIDRAFSHYWHEKKKGKINFEFEEVLQNYDLFSSWLEPGFYAEHIERYLQHFGRKQLLCLRFHTLQTDQRTFLKRILRFAGVDEKFEPSWLDRKSNEAGGRRTLANRVWRGIKKAVVRSSLETAARNMRLDEAAQSLEELPLIGEVLQDKREYEEGMDPTLRAELLQLCEPEIERLENLLDLSLDTWRE